MTPLVNWLVCAVEYDRQIFSKYLVFQIKGVKNPVFQHFWFEISRISIEIQGFDRNTRYLIEILGFLFEIVGISKMCEWRDTWYAEFYKVRSFYDHL